MRQKTFQPFSRKAIDLDNIHLKGNARQRRVQRRQIERLHGVKLIQQP